MKRTLALLLALVMLFALTATSAFAEDKAEEKPVELIVFAAASMTETLTEIKGMYEEANPGVTIVYNFDSSGTLKTQIQEGADCDVFISAGQKQMNQLDINADPKVNTDGLDFVLEGSRLNLLENKVTLVVPEGNPTGIKALLEIQGSITNRLRLPLVKASKQLTNKLTTLYNDFRG